VGYDWVGLLDVYPLPGYLQACIFAREVHSSARPSSPDEATHLFKPPPSQ